MPEGGRSYVGREGLLDVRVVVNENPIDEVRLHLAEAWLRELGGTAAIHSVQGRACLACRCRKGPALVLTYAFERRSNRELVAVYAFSNPASPLAQMVDEALLSAKSSHAVGIRLERRS
jgi:hypothetical protein